MYMYRYVGTVAVWLKERRREIVAPPCVRRSSCHVCNPLFFFFFFFFSLRVWRSGNLSMIDIINCRCHLIDCCNTYAGPGVADPCAFFFFFFLLSYTYLIPPRTYIGKFMQSWGRRFVWKEVSKYVRRYICTYRGRPRCRRCQMPDAQLPARFYVSIIHFKPVFPPFACGSFRIKEESLFAFRSNL